MPEEQFVVHDDVRARRAEVRRAALVRSIPSQELNLDGDGDSDVVSASKADDKIAWYPNDGSGNLGDQIIISTDADYAISVFCQDLDGDGDADVVSASLLDDKMAWYFNDGNGVSCRYHMQKLEIYLLLRVKTFSKPAADNATKMLNN